MHKQTLFGVFSGVMVTFEPCTGMDLGNVEFLISMSCLFIFSRIKKGEGQGKESVTIKR